MTMTNQGLSADTVELYNRDGYHLYKQPLFEQGRFDRLKGRFEALLDAHGPENLDTIHFENPDLLDYLMDDKVLDIVESLIGPDFGLWSSHFISKDPFKGKATPWHEDSGYWNGRFDRFSGIVTIWLAIDPAVRANGCMRVIPGTHGTECSEYSDVDMNENIFSSEIADVDESKAVYFELDPNECSLHDSRLIHGAEANNSPMRRCGYTMRYFSQDMKLNLDHPGNKQHKIWHCRGKNPHNNPVEN